MFSLRWRKVARDLWEYKARTVLVILSIAVGVFAVGLIAGTRTQLNREMNASWEAASPASVWFIASDFDEELLWSVRNMPEVAEADAKRGFNVRFKPGTVEEHRKDEGKTPWRMLQIHAIPNYEDMRVFKIEPEQGEWPPPEHDMLIDRATLAWMGVEVGGVVLIEAPNGKLREMEIAGTVHDITQMEASWTDRGAAYVSVDTLPWLGISRDFDVLNIIVAGDPFDTSNVEHMTENVKNKIEKSGRTVYFHRIENPGIHPADDSLAPILLILGTLGLLSLGLSGFLVINTLQALLAQQTRQIGVMRAIGGRSAQIIGIYYGMVLIFALIALTIAIPLAALGANAFTRYIATLTNFDIESYRIAPQVLALEAAVGLLMPLLAATFPIYSAMRITARKAMSDYGLSNGHFGQGIIDHFLERIRGLSRPLLFSLRNTFRRKGRLLLTLMTLTLAGGIFVAVFSTRSSLLLTLEDSFDYVRYDALVIFNRGYRVELIEREALDVPGVVAAESWRFNTARRVRADENESETIYVRAPRAESELIDPTLVEGRWLLPEDENAIVINTMILKDEPDIQLGDEITLKIEGDEINWQVVGIIKGTPPMPLAYVNLPYFSQVVGGVGRAGAVFVETEDHGAAFQDQIVKALEQRYENAGLNVNSTQTSQAERAQVENQFNVVVVFLLFMALLLALVGGIGLMGTMSLNVLERTREVGVMRAIGAASGAIRQIVIVEGTLIGLISCVTGILLSVPLSRLMSNTIGISLFQTALNYSFDLNGVWLWLILVLVISTLASLLPAWNASNMSVREALAYE